MNITSHRSQIRTIPSSDPKFTIQDGVVSCPRAGFEINHKCPQEYKQIIAQCIDNGWLKPVAHVTERELIFMGLTK